MGILENGPHFDRKGLFAGVAFAQAGAGGFAVHAAHAAGFAAVRAHRPVRPKPSLDIGQGGFFVGEMGGGKFACHGLDS